MHEMALSQSILKTAVDAADGKSERISRIAIEVGALSATNVESLSFWLDETLKSMDMEDTEVELDRPPAHCRCECGNEYETSDMFTGCPECGGFTRDILTGMDVTVKWVEVEDDEGTD